MTLWQFSETSQSLLRQCIEASTFDTNNRWIKKFGSKSDPLNKNEELSGYPNKDDIVTNHTANNMDVEDILTNHTENIKQVEDFWREVSELDPISHFDYIVEKCMENTNLYVFLAQKLPLISIEKLCKHVYQTENINPLFIEKFYTIFFPEFLKREPTRLSMHLLIEAKKNFVCFKYFLATIIKDTDLPDTILNDFISMLNIAEQTEFLVILSHTDIPKEVFVYHLITIHTVYKLGEKNSELQNYILSKLVEISDSCVTDKNYGRFLLDFLQSHRDYRTNISEIENIVESHRSAFRRPCLNILNEMK
ncbi:uncharacterized protein LOC128199688 [Bicyclus anynana]|uniref:Uncharacterized protein LOC128199688 n=1 Tax=Bicyclus anynana TaxID=110368 RepID=A0ABM3M5H2_BICAN|nr:uncharacterized protein LOC128199688 [Bicyclus anynana]